MTHAQFSKIKTRLKAMAALNTTFDPPRTEIAVNRKDLKIMMTRYKAHLDFDHAGNAVVDGSRLVPS